MMNVNFHKKHVQGVFRQGRRNFLRMAALGSGVSLLMAAPMSRSAFAASRTEALLLSCMDFRLMDEIERYMSGRGLRDKYDHIILAGAALGALTDKYPAWNKTFWDHLDIAIKLHEIGTVIVMDHRDCGAYKVILGPDHTANPELEKATHAAHLHKLRKMIHTKHPALKVETLFMSLDGEVETVS